MRPNPLPFATENIATKSQPPMAHGKPAAAGGPPASGIWRSGTCSPRATMAQPSHACWFAIIRAMNGGWRRTLTEPAEYVELHASSAFSFLAGASQPESLIERAAEIGMPSMALADRNGVYGVARFHTASKKCGIKAHIGAEIAISSFGSSLTPSSWLPHQYPNEPPRIVLLCASQVGYQNLCQ